MGALSKLLCPIQRDLEDLALTLEEKEKDDSVVPRKDYDALTRDIEGLKKQVSELSSVHTSMKAKIDTLTTEKRDLEKQIQELEKERQDCDRIRARMERYLSERDSLRAHQSEWERAKVTMGRPRAPISELAVAKPLLEPPRSRRFGHAGLDARRRDLGERKRGVGLRIVRRIHRLSRKSESIPSIVFTAGTPPKQSGPDKDSNSKGSTAGKSSSSSGAPTRAADSSKSGGKTTDKAPQKSKSAPSKSDGNKKNHGSSDFDASELDFGIGAKPAKRASEDRNPCANRVQREKPF
ncbi:unnamed protein product [Aphanomyces euteiches]